MILVAMAIAFGIVATLYVLSRIEWSGTEQSFRLRWVVLGLIPFSSRTLRFDEVDEVRPYAFRRDHKIWAQFLGPVWPAPRGRILIRLKPSARRLMKAYVIAPKDPEAFVDWMKARTRASLNRENPSR
jgi:hypothetical protein